MKRILAWNLKALAVSLGFIVGLTFAYIAYRYTIGIQLSEPKELPPIESPDPITSLAVTPDGKLIVSKDTKGKINFWDSNTGERQKSLPGKFTAIAISADGTILVSASEEGIIKVWDLTTKTELDSFNSNHQITTEPRKPITALAISADGRFLIGGDEGGDVSIWNLADREVMTAWEGQTRVQSLAVSQDAQIIVSSNFDREIKFWKNLNNNDEDRTSKSVDEVHAVAISEDGQKIISSSCPDQIWLWNLKSWERSSITSDTNICLASISPDGKKIAGINLDGDVKVWNVTSETELKEPKVMSLPPGTERSIAFSRDGRVIAVGLGKTIQAWKLSD